MGFYKAHRKEHLNYQLIKDYLNRFSTCDYLYEIPYKHKLILEIYFYV